MVDFFLALAIIAIIGGAIFYIVKAKKSGVKCIGCPAGANCPGKSAGHSQCSCSCQSDAKGE